MGCWRRTVISVHIVSMDIVSRSNWSVNRSRRRHILDMRESCLDTGRSGVRARRSGGKGLLCQSAKGFWGPEQQRVSHAPEIISMAMVKRGK